MAVYVKLAGSPMASDVYTGEGSIANLTDVNKSTLWHSNGANESTHNSFCGINFSEDQSVAKIEIDFARWGSKIVIGYASTQPAASSGFTVVRTIDTKLVATDDLGDAWGSDRLGKRTNTIILTGAPAAKCWGIINLDNASSPLSDGTTANSRLTVYEIAMYKDSAAGTPPVLYAPATGNVPTASGQYNDFGTIDSIADGNPATGWSSVYTFSNAPLDFLGYVFPVAQEVRKLEVNLYTWGKTIVVGTAASWPGSKTALTILRTIDVTVTPNDDLGVPWAKQTKNTILLPAGTSAKVIAVYTNNSEANILSSGGVDRLRVVEMAAFVEAPATSELTGTAFCDKSIWFSSNDPYFAPSRMNDGDDTTTLGAWAGSFQSPSTTDSTLNFAGVKFAGLADVAEIKIKILSWGRSFRIGTWSVGNDPASAAFTKANIIPISTFDTSVDKDADGLTAAKNIWLRYTCSKLQVPGLIFYCDSNATNPLADRSGTGLTNTNLCISEVKIYGGNVTAAPTPPEIRNPKPPAVIPVSPFNASSVGWVRTEFTVAGLFNFTPDPATTLLFVAIQGAGAGGAVKRNLDNSIPVLGPSLNGGETYVAVSDGKVWSVEGSQQQVPGVTDISPEGHANWVRTPLVVAATIANTNDLVPTAQAGTANALGTAGVSYTLAQTAPPDGSANSSNFTIENGSANGWVAQTVSAFEWASGAGWRNTNHANSSQGYVNFQPVNFKAGQTIRFYYNISSEYNRDQLFIYVNGGQIFRSMATTTGSSVLYTVPLDGSYTIEFRYSKDGTVNIGTDTTNVTSIVVASSSAFYPPTQGGGGNRAVTGFLLPAPLQLRIGQGGIGVTGGQTIPANAHGTRGGGGAAGGNGGDGVIVIYEFTQPLTSTEPPLPLLANYNVTTAEMLGLYRTNYYGKATAVGALVKTKENFIHKLRPRTKRVLVVMVGAGGGSCSPYDYSQNVYQSDPTIVSTGTKTLTAGSGVSAIKSDAYTRLPGAGGVFTSDVTANYSKNGDEGRWMGQTGGGLPSGFINFYGNSSDSSPIAGSSGTVDITDSGGAGAIAFVILNEDHFVSRELSIQVPAGGPAAFQVGRPGAVFIFESESDLFYPLVSQVGELVLQRTSQSLTQVSQVQQLVLQETPQAVTNVSQVAFMVLQRTVKVPGTLVTESTIELITSADPGAVRVSQNIQSVLVESGPPTLNASQVATLVLIKENPTLLQIMDFGVMRYPTKNELYLSRIQKVDGIGQGKTLRFQLEGDLPIGSTIIHNGLDANSLTVMIKDGDTLQLRSGVTNFFASVLYVYVYVTRVDQIVREYAGFWSVMQAALSGRKRATIGALGKFASMKLAKSNLVLGAIKAIAPRSAKESKVSPTVLKTSENGIKATVTQKVAKATTLLSGSHVFIPDAPLAVTFDSEGADHTTGEAALSDVKTFARTTVEDAISIKQTFDYAPGYAVLTGAQNFERTYLKDSTSQPNGFTKRGIGASCDFEAWAQASVGPSFGWTDVTYKAAVSPAQATNNTAYNKIGAMGFRPADQNFLRDFAAGYATRETLDYTAAITQASSFFRSAFLYSPSYVSTQSDPIEFTTQENDKVALIEQHYKENSMLGLVPITPGYVWRSSPQADIVGRREAVPAVSINRTFWGGLGFTDVHAPAYISVGNDFIARENPGQIGRNREFAARLSNAATGLTQTYSARIYNATLIPVEYKVSKAKATLYGMKPVLYQAGKNQIDKAKYYMGFTTQEEVNAFIVNFLRPTTKTKLDGYVYRVGTDDTLVCEVRGPNMPLAWLMHGG